MRGPGTVKTYSGPCHDPKGYEMDIQSICFAFVAEYAATSAKLLLCSAPPRTRSPGPIPGDRWRAHPEPGGSQAGSASGLWLLCGHLRRFYAPRHVARSRASRLAAFRASSARRRASAASCVCFFGSRA